jgi:hypothetical protein
MRMMGRGMMGGMGRRMTGGGKMMQNMAKALERIVKLSEPLDRTDRFFLADAPQSEMSAREIAGFLNRSENYIRERVNTPMRTYAARFSSFSGKLGQ